MNRYIKLDPEDIRMLHQDMLEAYGGLAGEYEPRLIDFMAEKPFQEAFGQELYPGLFMKAAVYMEGFATHQYFCDGNKRTGVMCMLTFLHINGYRLTVNPMDLYHIAKSVANGETKLEALAEWIEQHSKSV